jgi:hypothetical protein
VRVEVIRESR